jgi:hypothetical protein
MPLVIEFYVFKRRTQSWRGHTLGGAKLEINIALQKNSKHV